MGQLVFQANAGGQTALVGPNPSTSISINIPATNGNMVTTGDTGTVTSTMLATSVYTAPGTIGSGTPNSGAFTSLSSTSGTLNGSIGATTANTGAFTTLSASSTVSGTGFTNYLASPPAIGGTAPSTGAFTTSSLKGSTSGAITLAAPAVAGTNTATFPASTGEVMVSGNMPAFSAYQSSAQTLSTNTTTKILFQTEEFDTNNNFTNSTFTPTVAGYYQVSASIRIGTTSATIRMIIAKNGNNYKLGTDIATSTNGLVTTLVYCNGTTDYVEAYALIGVGQVLSASSVDTWFNGSMVRGA